MRDYKLAQQHCICQLTGVVRQALIHIWKNKDKILIMLKQAKIRLSQPHPDGWCLSVFLGLKLSPLEQMCVQTHHPVNQCAARWAKRTFILFVFFCWLQALSQCFLHHGAFTLQPPAVHLQMDPNPHQVFTRQLPEHSDLSLGHGLNKQRVWKV